MVHDLEDQVNNLMAKFKRHFFNIFHQFKMYKSLKESLRENEILLHIYFSGNYPCKSNREIQSVHVGAKQTDRVAHYECLLAAQQLFPIPNTKKLHQIVSKGSNNISLRNMCCSCQCESSWTNRWNKTHPIPIIAWYKYRFRKLWHTYIPCRSG